MDKEKITQLESVNDGQTIHLFYDEMAGLYAAFGQSAFYTTAVTEPLISYSMAVGMPVALLGRSHILYMRQSLKKVEHAQKSYYQFKMRQPIGSFGYDKWAKKAKSDSERMPGKKQNT